MREKIWKMDLGPCPESVAKHWALTSSCVSFQCLESKWVHLDDMLGFCQFPLILGLSCLPGGLDCPVLLIASFFVKVKAKEVLSAEAGEEQELVGKSPHGGTEGSLCRI